MDQILANSRKGNCYEENRCCERSTRIRMNQMQMVMTTTTMIMKSINKCNMTMGNPCCVMMNSKHCKMNMNSIATIMGIIPLHNSISSHHFNSINNRNHQNQNEKNNLKNHHQNQNHPKEITPYPTCQMRKRNKNKMKKHPYSSRHPIISIPPLTIIQTSMLRA